MVFLRKTDPVATSLFCLLFFFFPAHTPAEGFPVQTPAGVSPALKEAPPAIQKAARSVWMLSGEEATGSGFFLNPRLLVTNFHVAAQLLKLRDLSNIVLSQNGKAGEIEIQRIILADAVRDIALLETDRDAPFYLSLREEPLFEAELLSENENVFVLGYPGGAFRAIKNTTSLRRFHNEMTFFIDHTEMEGASGGPVLDSQGLAVGILYAGVGNMVIAAELAQLQSALKEATDTPCGKEHPERCLKRSFDLALKAAGEGNVVAQFRVGHIYEEGYGVEQDLAKAAFWYGQAAEQGDTAAQDNLGSMYWEGNGVEQDLEKAALWFERAAEQGYAAAQNNLGIMYRKGLGVKQDLEKAVYWFERAAEQGYAAAQYNLGIIYWKGYGVKRDLEKAIFWLNQATEQGHTTAQFILIYLEKRRLEGILKRRLFGLNERRNKAMPQLKINLALCMGDALTFRGILKSFERIREELSEVQVSRVRDEETRRRFLLPSKPTATQKIIYRVFNKNLHQLS